MGNILPIFVSLFGLISGLVILFIATYALRYSSKQTAILSKWPTYSKSVNRALLDRGIYTEHGMVTDEAGRTVKAQCKRSNAFYDSYL